MCKLSKGVSLIHPRYPKENCVPVDNQHYDSPNRHGIASSGNDSVLLGQPMEVVKMGVEQYVAVGEDGSVGRPPRNKWPHTPEEIVDDAQNLKRSNRHYPDVDLYRCKHCGAVVIVE